MLGSTGGEFIDLLLEFQYSQAKSVGLVGGLAAIRRSVCTHQMNRVNSRSDYGHDFMTAP